jgi:hypothetical protein
MRAAYELDHRGEWGRNRDTDFIAAPWISQHVLFLLKGSVLTSGQLSAAIDGDVASLFARVAMQAGRHPKVMKIQTVCEQIRPGARLMCESWTDVCVGASAHRRSSESWTHPACPCRRQANCERSFCTGVQAGIINELLPGKFVLVLFCAIRSLTCLLETLPVSR